MYIVPGQEQVTWDKKNLSLDKSYCYFDHFVQFYHDTPNSKGTRGQKNTFLYIDKCHNSVIKYGNMPINNPNPDIVGTNAYAKFE